GTNLPLRVCPQFPQRLTTPPHTRSSEPLTHAPGPPAGTEPPPAPPPRRYRRRPPPRRPPSLVPAAPGARPPGIGAELRPRERPGATPARLPSAPGSRGGPPAARTPALPRQPPRPGSARLLSAAAPPGPGPRYLPGLLQRRLRSGPPAGAGDAPGPCGAASAR
ncbi:unnamed protein product, partial [Bubo scandiacus]